MKRSRKRFRTAVAVVCAVLVCSILVVGWKGYQGATADPVVRSLRIADRSWPAGVAPVRILLLSDFHVQGPDMPPDRLARIVEQANSLHPDVVVLAGDFMGSNALQTRSYSVEQAVRPLGLLHSKLGNFAVLGNHDRDNPQQTRAALEHVGVTVLENEAVQLGPIALGGVRQRVRSTLKQLLRLKGFRVIVAHWPDLFPRVPSSVRLMLAGHTHCGQIILPWIGPIDTGSNFGTKYMCGVHQEQGKTLVVTAGLGTSKAPVRIGAPPDMWLITIGDRTVSAGT